MPNRTSIRDAIRVALTGYVTASVIQVTTAKHKTPSIRCPAIDKPFGVGSANTITSTINARMRPYFLAKLVRMGGVPSNAFFSNPCSFSAIFESLLNNPTEIK